MDNRNQLQQVRKGIAFQIAQSPDTIIVSRVPNVPDGFGGLMPDPSGIPVEFRYVVRLSHERSGVRQQEQQPSGVDTALSQWVLGNHLLVLNEGEVFESVAQGRRYKVGVVDALRKFGGVTAYQAPLFPAGDVPPGLVTGVSLNGTDPESLMVNDTFQLVATIEPADAADQTVSWESSDTGVVEVYDDGSVLAIGVGTATVTVTTNNGGFMAARVFEVS